MLVKQSSDHQHSLWTFVYVDILLCLMRQIDPVRTISAGKVNLGAFRTYPKVRQLLITLRWSMSNFLIKISVGWFNRGKKWVTESWDTYWICCLVLYSLCFLRRLCSSLCWYDFQKLFAWTLKALHFFPFFWVPFFCSGLSATRCWAIRLPEHSAGENRGLWCAC